MIPSVKSWTPPKIAIVEAGDSASLDRAEFAAQGYCEAGSRVRTLAPEVAA